MSSENTNLSSENTNLSSENTNLSSENTNLSSENTNLSQQKYIDKINITHMSVDLINKSIFLGINLLDNNSDIVDSFKSELTESDFTNIINLENLNKAIITKLGFSNN